MVVMPLREAVRKLSVGTGQGYVRCHCAPHITAKCSTNQCSCKFAKIPCNSKCHGKSEFKIYKFFELNERFKRWRRT